MCDTLVALGSATVDGSVILAKNSDRAPNEAQYPVFFPRTQHREATVRCTHIEIPQVGETFAVLLSKPFWMWGCEMGANEFGVVIGNEAVWTKEPIAKTGLLGMDLIRLALERADTARGALDVITDLLTTHGQGGVCDIHYPSASYHNSFLIADPGAAWVLETADRYWAAKKVEDVYSISNLLTKGGPASGCMRIRERFRLRQCLAFCGTTARARAIHRGAQAGPAGRSACTLRTNSSAAASRQPRWWPTCALGCRSTG
jgi:secernin